MKKTRTGIFSLLIIAALMIMAQSAWAYSAYAYRRRSGKIAPHATEISLMAAPYVSNVDGVAWSNPDTGSSGKPA